MGKAYYYFAATLPSLQFGEKPSKTIEEFLNDAERLLSTEDYATLDALLNQKEISQNNKILEQWDEFNRTLHNGIAFYRATKANKDPAPYLRGDYFEDPLIQGIIQSADKAADPLDGEKVLARARWQFLNDLSAGQFFNFEFITIYALQLKILNRFDVIQSPKGKEIYEELKKIEFPEGIVMTTV